MNFQNLYVEITVNMLAFFGPLNLVALFVVLWALMRLRRYGRIARLIAIGYGFILSSVFLLIAYLILDRTQGPLLPRNSEWFRADIVGLFLWSLFTAIGFGFLLYAALTDRKPQPPSTS